MTRNYGAGTRDMSRAGAFFAYRVNQRAKMTTL